MGEYIYNEDDGKIIAGTTEADTIENYGANVSINADKGDDTIWNWNRGDEDGNITLSPDGTTINGGAGNDDITNDGSDVSISGGSGNDTVNNLGANVTIDGGKGNDSINNNGGNENVLFVYSGGNDIIEGFNESSTLKISSGTLDTLATLSGEDILLTVGKNVITLGGAAWLENFNVVNSKGKAVTLGYKITGTDGADDIGNDRAGTIIDALAGNDTVTNWAANVTIDGGKGKDLLISWSDGETSINGGAGNDSIEIGGANVTAAGGTGNDSISLGTIGFAYVYGGGNDTIRGFDNKSYLVFDGDFSSERLLDSDGNETDTVVVTVSGKGSITLTECYTDDIRVVSSVADVPKVNYISNETDGAKLTGTAGNDQVDNTGASNVTIRTLAGDDTVNNSYSDDGAADKVYINTSDGNDEIYNNGANVTILAGAGDDEIRNDGGWRVSISGGDGDDIVFNSGEGSTLRGGKGDDFFANEGTNALLDGGDGNDDINNYSANVTIDGGKGDDGVYNGADATGTTIDAGAGDDEINNEGAGVKISAGDGNDTAENYGASVSISGGKGDDGVYNGGSDVLIDGGAGNDWIQNSGTNSTLSGGKGNDSLDNWADGANSLLDAGAGNDELYNEAAGATLAGGTGDNTLRNNGGENVLFRHGGGNDLIEGFNDSSTLQIASGNFNKIIETDGANLYLTVGEKVITLEGAAELEKINLVNTKGKTVSYSLAPATLIGTDGDDRFEIYVDGAAVNAGKGNDFIQNIGGKNVSLVGGAGNDQIFNQANSEWNAETGEWEIVSSPDNATISAGSGDDDVYNEGANVLFRYMGGDDTINGFNETSTLQIYSGKLNSVTSDGDHLFLSVDDNFITLYGGAQLETINVVNSKGRPIAFTVEDVNIVDNVKNSVTLTGTDDRDRIINSGEKVLVNALGGDDTLTNLGADSTLDAGTGNDYVDNIADGSTFDLGAGNDNIWNEGANVSIAGGKGNDEIRNSVGNGVTLNGGSGNDFIQNSGGSNVSINAGKGDDFIYNEMLDTWNEETDEEEIITPDKVTIAAGDGNDYIRNYQGTNVSINAGAGDDTVDNESSLVTIAGGAGNDYISSVGDSVIISGGSGNDEIDNEGAGVKISGGAGDDTLWGNASNDTLTGGAGDDCFIIRPGEGKTYITDFASNDLLQILDADGGDGSFTNSSYKNSNLTLAIEGGGHVVFSGVNADTSFNINGTSYSISGSKLK